MRAADALGLVACVPALYAAAGLAGGAISRNASWREPPRGVAIHVESNGVHVGLVLPRRAAGWDWSRVFPARDLADPRYAALDHVAIGWGEEGFYRGTPRWRDVRPATLLHAATGSDRTLLHVEHVAAPVDDAATRRVLLRPAEYRRLVAAILRSRAAGPAQRGYGADDAFYPARGHYDAIRTCNAWASDTLAAAGVRVGWWTPFPVTVTGWFPAGR